MLRKIKPEAEAADVESVEHPPDVPAGAVLPEEMQVCELGIGQEPVESFPVAPFHEDECLPWFLIAKLRKVSGVLAERDDTAAVASDRFRRSTRVRAVVHVVGDVEQIQRVQSHLARRYPADQSIVGT